MAQVLEVAGRNFRATISFDFGVWDMQHQLPPEVRILPGTDLERVWENTAAYSAAYGAMATWTPLSDYDISALIGALNSREGDRILDIGCGQGSLLRSVAASTPVVGFGIDVSPWAVSEAAYRSRGLTFPGSIQWWVGDARELIPTNAWDAVVCLGSVSIWGGLDAAVSHLVTLLRRDGRLAVGEVEIDADIDRSAIEPWFALATTRRERLASFDHHGLRVARELVVSPSTWDRHWERVVQCSVEYHRRAGSELSASLLDSARQAQGVHIRHRDSLSWTVSIAVKM